MDEKLEGKSIPADPDEGMRELYGDEPTVVETTVGEALAMTKEEFAAWYKKRFEEEVRKRRMPNDTRG